MDLTFTLPSEMHFDPFEMESPTKGCSYHIPEMCYLLVRTLSQEPDFKEFEDKFEVMKTYITHNPQNRERLLREMPIFFAAQKFLSINESKNAIICSKLHKVAMQLIPNCPYKYSFFLLIH